MAEFCFALFSCCLVLVCLTSCGLLRRNGARLREMADSRVLAAARRIHIRRRAAVLRDSPHFRRFRPAGGGEASRAWHLWSSSARCSGSRPHSRSLRRRSRRLRSSCARRRFVSELNPRQMCRDAIRRYMTLIDSDCLSLYFVSTVIAVPQVRIF